jgi:heme exporter protein A
MYGRIPIQRIELQGVGKLFGSTVALRGVNALFESGRLHLLLGANGSGKSTLLAIMGTMLRASSGRVSYGSGLTLSQVRSEVGWVSHEGLVYPEMSGWDVVSFTAKLHGLDSSTASRVASERFGLGKFAERPFRSNSRGQRQRISLARALLPGPALVLLDEPTAGLDVDGVSVLVKVIGEEVERGATVIVVSHEPEIFESFGPRVLRLERGRVIEDRT